MKRPFSHKKKPTSDRQRIALQCKYTLGCDDAYSHIATKKRFFRTLQCHSGLQLYEYQSQINIKIPQLVRGGNGINC